MSQATVDTWYVRFPDGRVARAASTALVRQQLGSGRIPGTSTVRRHPDEEWQSLEWTKEFADLAGGSGTHEPIPPAPDRPAEPRPRRQPKEGPATVASRLDPNQLQTVGVGQAMHELVAALDSTLVQRKLIVAIAVGLSLGVLLGIPVVAGFDSGARADVFTRGGIALGVWLITSVACALLTQMTFIEVSRLRPARWKEALQGNTGRTIRLALANLIVMGTAVGLIYLLRRAPDWVEPAENAGGAVQHHLATWAVILSLVLEMGTWPVFGLGLLLGPIVIVENCSVWKALRQWVALLQQDLGRAFLYEALALGLGLVVALPLIAPLVASYDLFQGTRLEFAATFTRIVLGCFVLAPVAAYLVVANMFIYLNLRYEAGARRG